MSRPNAPPEPIPEDPRRPVRKRVRVKVAPPPRQRLKRWWRRHRRTHLSWLALALGAAVLFGLTFAGCIQRSPPPME